MAKSTLLFLSEDEVAQTLTVAESIELAGKGIAADGNGKVAGSKFYMTVGQNNFLKPFSGYMDGEEYAYVKIFSYFPNNPKEHNLPTTASQVILYDAKTGVPVCLMEADWITGLKTAASTAVTAKGLALPQTHTITIFGAGMQGRMHTRALSYVRQLKKVYLLDKFPEVAQKAAQDLSSELDLSIQPVALEDREACVRASQLVFTVTTGSQVLVEKEWLQPGTFVAKLGSYQEVALDVITQADKVIVDNWGYVSPRTPELVKLLEEGKFSKQDIYAEWPDIVGGRIKGRESQQEIIVYIALGIWGEYAAILPEAYRRAVSMGLGKPLEITLGKKL